MYADNEERAAFFLLVWPTCTRFNLEALKHFLKHFSKCVEHCLLVDPNPQGKFYNNSYMYRVHVGV